MSSSSFAKRERDLAKKAKAEAKRQRRQAMAAEQASGNPDGPPDGAADSGLSTPDLLQRIEEVHRLRDEGLINEEDFNDTKTELLGQLRVD